VAPCARRHGRGAPQGYATLHTPEGLALDFLPVPEPKTGKNRLHLDGRSRDFATAVAQALALGATRADDIYAGGRWQVLRDPEGNEFCVLRACPIHYVRAS
jgi:hypothetical protein